MLMAFYDCMSACVCFCQRNKAWTSWLMWQEGHFSNYCDTQSTEIHLSVFNGRNFEVCDWWKSQRIRVIAECYNEVNLSSCSQFPKKN